MTNYDVLEHYNLDAKNTVVINWLLGNTCNYTCSYCPSFLHEGSVGWPKIELVKKFVDYAIKQYSGKKIYFEFTGGEVTLWKNFIELCEYIKYTNNYVGFISNGTMSNSFWIKNIDKFDHVCLSYHPQFANKYKFLEKASILSNNVRTHINIMMDPNYWDECITLAEQIADNLTNISLALQPLMEELGEHETVFPYTDYQKFILDKQHLLYGKFVKQTKNFYVPRGAMQLLNTKTKKTVLSSAHRLISNKENNWEGWKCYAGLEQLIIDHDGSLYRGWCKQGGSLGNLWTEFEFPKQPIICKKQFCHCNLDIMCKKVANV